MSLGQKSYRPLSIRKNTPRLSVPLGYVHKIVYGLSLGMLIFFFLTIGLLLSAQNVMGQDGIVQQAYHNTTAHYNAYWIAREKLREVDIYIKEATKNNYNKILPIKLDFDTIMLSAKQDDLQDIIEKASIAIQRHETSKWVDDSYILVGRARLYRYEFPEAIETFKYVNTKGKDTYAKHEALIHLLHTFIKYEETKNAQAVSDYLDRQKLNKKNKKDFYLMKAYMYQKANDLDNMVKYLDLATDMLKRQDDRARLYFILGQVYQELGFESLAYDKYKEVLKYNPEYELSFYTKLNMAQVTRLADGSDIKKIRKYFKKLLKDDKNVEYKDKIYYEMGQFEKKQGEIPLALKHYNSSVQASVNNNRQKGYSYLEMGRLYYDTLRNFRMAKNYYDSTVSVLPKDEDNYKEIKDRQEILENFVKQLDIIQKNDSLIQLAKMDTSELNVFLDEVIQEIKVADEAEAKRKKAEEKKKRSGGAFAGGSMMGDQGGFDANLKVGGRWYFYNASALSRGRNEFRSNWGERKLEDNWRRSSSGSNADEMFAEGQDGSEELVQEEEIQDEADRIDPYEQKKQEFLASIPFEAAEQKKLLGEVEEAMYLLGNIYNFELIEKRNAVGTFEELLERFPNTEHRLEVLYLKYLIYKDLESERMEVPKNDLLSNHPQSLYAKLILNPNYREESDKASEQLKKIYKEAFQHYKRNNFRVALDLVQQGLEKYPDNDFVDNMKMLEVLMVGKTENMYQYQFALNEFMESYSESELVPYAQKLLEATETFKKRQSEEKAIQYIPYFEQKHFFVLVYPTAEKKGERFLKWVNEFIESKEEFKELTTANLMLGDENSLILVNEFNGKKEAMEFFISFNYKQNVPQDLLKSKFDNFVITQDNFQIFYQNKRLKPYIDFFDFQYFE